MLYSEFKRDCAEVGNLIIRRGTGAFMDLSPMNEMLAEVYSLAVIAWLKLNGGKGNMHDFYCSPIQPADLPMYLAVHNLRNRGVIVCLDPYDVRSHTDVEMMLVDIDSTEGWGQFCTRRRKSIAAHRIGMEVKWELEKFRKELFSG